MFQSEYIDFLIHFHTDRDFFECHEILEEFWKENDPTNKNSIWVAFILLAVSAYHHRRKNFAGALRTLLKAKAIFSLNRVNIRSLGLNGDGLFALINERQFLIEHKNSFTQFSLPISDAKLLAFCQKECEQRAIVWNDEFYIPTDEIIHRHLTRDRSSVINEREQAIMNKKKGNE